MNTRRIAVSFLNAFEIPFAVIAGVNYNTNPLISLVCVIVAAACAYGYTAYKPYWNNGNGNGKN